MLKISKGTLPYLALMAVVLSHYGCRETKEASSTLSAPMKHVDKYIQNGEIDSAYIHIQQILNTNDQQDADYDSALSLYLQIQKLYQLRISSAHIKILLELDNSEYEALQNHELAKSFLSDKRLNAVYLSELSRLADDGGRTADPPPELNDRRQYAKDLERSFQDMGFEITVTVNGADDRYLILSSVIFNDEWFQKFESSGEMEEWHSQGYNRIELRNGSGYSRHKNW